MLRTAETALVGTAFIALTALGCNGRGLGGGASGPAPVVRDLLAGARQTCVVLESEVRCWGHWDSGGTSHGTGLGYAEALGDDEPAWAGDAINLGGHSVVRGAAGAGVGLGVSSNGEVIAWGGPACEPSLLGPEFVTACSPADLARCTRGDEDDPALSLPISGRARSVSVSRTEGCNASGCRGARACALLDDGTLRCWGEGPGYPGSCTVGYNTAIDAGPLDVGEPVEEVAVGLSIACARLPDGRVRCWGLGVLGYLQDEGCEAGSEGVCCVGCSAPPKDAGNVELGGPATKIAAGELHACALIEGDVVCWGYGYDGRLGYGNTDDVGDDEWPSEVGVVSLGVAIATLAAGESHTCALTVDGNVRCWGLGEGGRLGYGNEESIGDDEEPRSAGDVDIGEPIATIAAGSAHTCALAESGDVYCWGRATDGQLGYGDVSAVGDDETPRQKGSVPFY